MLFLRVKGDNFQLFHVHGLPFFGDFPIVLFRRRNRVSVLLKLKLILNLIFPLTSIIITFLLMET